MLASLTACGDGSDGSTAGGGDASTTAGVGGSGGGGGAGGGTTTGGGAGGGAPVDPLGYCRSDDPAWRAKYDVTPIDAELADVIALAGLEGDPSLYRDAEGQCRVRTLPSIEAPMAELGRALFFTKDLSGDRDVACASCHHPELGGGDAISLSVGPTSDPDAMGADRVRGATDASAYKVPRNALTTFNIGFWDDGEFWDSRVRSLDPKLGHNGDGPAGIATPDSTNPVSKDGSAGHNLTEAQARFPVTEEHEMAGSFAALYPSREAIRDALAARMRDDAQWLARFEAACADPNLPASWAEACAVTAPDARAEALVTFANAAFAIGEYERSQVFTDSPWKAYVQGDVAAIGEGAKRGALLFLRRKAEGGQNCVACHRGDFFTDEGFHAVGSPQIGPGKANLTDEGRGLVEGDGGHRFAFRTPTLLNVEVTAPYFHSGAYATLAKTIAHYTNQNGRIFEYFGTNNKADTNPKPWCRMTQFASIPDCATLYTSDHTHDGNVTDFLDPEADGLQTIEADRVAFLEQFLEALTDPRVKDKQALAPWVDPESTLAVTPTSSEWDEYCDVMIDRASDLRLREKGLRWLVTGAIVDGKTVNDGEALYDTFGVDAWWTFDRRFTANSGLDQADKQLATATLEVLAPEQRQALYDAYKALTTRGNHPQILQKRVEVFGRMNARRAGQPVADSEFSSRITQAGLLEGQDLFAMAKAYRATLAAIPAQDRDAHLATLRAIQQGDLSMMPPGVYTKGQKKLTQSDSIRMEVTLATKNGTIPFDAFVAGYATWTTGHRCRYTFMTRLEQDERHANYYGFANWASGYLFDLKTGDIGSGGLQEEIATYVAAQESALGLTPLFDATLTASNAKRKQYDAARAALVDALMEVADPALSPAQVDALEPSIVAASQAVAQRDAELLLVELGYYLGLYQATQQAGSTNLAQYLACIESPATQAMKGNGGFDALGGGTCEP